MIPDLYKRIPDTRITDILMEVDSAIDFTNAFPYRQYQRTAQSTISPPKWRPLKSLMRQPLTQANADSSPTQAEFCNRAT